MQFGRPEPQELVDPEQHLFGSRLAQEIPDCKGRLEERLGILTAKDCLQSLMADPDIGKDPGKIDPRRLILAMSNTDPGQPVDILLGNIGSEDGQDPLARSGPERMLERMTERADAGEVVSLGHAVPAEVIDLHHTGDMNPALGATLTIPLQDVSTDIR